MPNLARTGSRTAKRGFENEAMIVEKFNNWETDSNARKWLEIMGYDLKEIERVEAVRLHGYKTDVQVKVTIYMKKAVDTENLSIKLISNPKGFNQVDKRWVDSYIELWDIPDNVRRGLKLFTGEIEPSRTGSRDPRRMFLDEVSEDMREAIIRFFRENKLLVVSDILKGRGKFSAGWMLVVLRQKKRETCWVLKSINHAMNVFGGGDVVFSPRGSLKIGKITMQRKGGDAGRETSKMLQFKINPAELFSKGTLATK